MTRTDELDLITIDGVTCCHGHVLPFGASLLSNGGINFSINSADAEGCRKMRASYAKAGTTTLMATFASATPESISTLSTGFSPMVSLMNCAA